MTEVRGAKRRQFVWPRTPRAAPEGGRHCLQASLPCHWSLENKLHWVRDVDLAKTDPHPPAVIPTKVGTQ
jgi:hypothetical protein